MVRRAIWFLALAAMTGCEDDAELCPSPIVWIRDPELLVCTPHKAPTAACPLLTIPPWPGCGAPCEPIKSATACAATAGCRLAWLECLDFPQECDHEGGFIGCYGVTSLPPPPGACADILDPDQCAAREDCAGFYHKGPTCPGGDPYGRSLPNGEACRFSFLSCVDELSPPS